jgi:hypothetical protein
MLLVQVGTQDISPLSWAIESGSLEAARAIIKDLLTIRADRDNYYYGMDDLFRRHPDVLKKLIDNAPNLIPDLLDGLIWRNRVAEGGYRAVNYYIRHLLFSSDGNFHSSTKWLATFADPSIVCHPVVVVLSDLVWARWHS